MMVGSNSEIVEQQQRHLPHDLITDHIATRLPIKSLIRFKSVSKLWYSTISCHKFAKTHFKLSPFSHPTSPTHCIFIQSGKSFNLYYCNDDIDGRKGLVKLETDFDVLGNNEFHLVGSCNGIVCLASLSGYVIVLWNPITNQWCKIAGPCPYSLESFPNCRVSWGFGYALSIDDYKVVQIIEMPNTLEILVHVFSLRGNRWRRIDDDLYQDLFSLKMTMGFRYMTGSGCDDKYPSSFETECGVLVNETLYWIVSRTKGSGRKIVGFNLVLETFDKYPHREPRTSKVYQDKFLCVLGGCLSICGFTTHGDIYVIMLKHPQDESSFRLVKDWSSSLCKDLVGFTRTGKYFINLRRSLRLIDPNSSLMKCTTLVTGRKIDIANYVPSLISPTFISGLQDE